MIVKVLYRKEIFSRQDSNEGGEDSRWDEILTCEHIQATVENLS